MCQKQGVWKSKKKSHLTLRAKRATFTFWVDKISSKMPKMIHFDEFLKNQSLRPNSVTRQDKNLWEMPKFKPSNATFWVIFKQCGFIFCRFFEFFRLLKRLLGLFPFFFGGENEVKRDWARAWLFWPFKDPSDLSINLYESYDESHGCTPT